MTSIPDATNVVLTEEERAELDALARSTKTEHRLRQRARIVLLAAEGVATRAIGRQRARIGLLAAEGGATRAIGRGGGGTTGTASKWRGAGPPRRRGRGRWGARAARRAHKH